MYKLTIELKDAGEYQTFPEAFKEMYRLVKEMVEKGTSLQMVETTNWVEYEVDGKGSSPLLIYDAKDLAYRIGLLNEDGKLQDDFQMDFNKNALIDLAFLKGAMKMELAVKNMEKEIARLKASSG